MSNQDGSREEAATDLPVRRSKWVWILVGVFTLTVVFLLIRGLVYAGKDGPVGSGVSDATQDNVVTTNQAR